MLLERDRPLRGFDVVGALTWPEMLAPRPLWVSPDGCRLYISGSSVNGASMSDVWVLSRGR